MAGIEVLYEDEDILAVNKPAGLLVHHAPNYEGAEPTLVDWLVQYRPEVKSVGDDPVTRPGIVHRLDRDTSGVMVVAKTQQAFERIKSLFGMRDVRKSYVAIVRGRLAEKSGSITAPIGIVNGTTRRSVRSLKMAKPARTEYRVQHEWEVRRGVWVSALDVSPRTGRTHQIRVHLASIGHPIVGDVIYGRRGKDPIHVGRLMLHAEGIELDVVPGRRVRIEAPLPAEFRIPGT